MDNHLDERIRRIASVFEDPEYARGLLHELVSRADNKVLSELEIAAEKEIARRLTLPSLRQRKEAIAALFVNSKRAMTLLNKYVNDDLSPLLELMENRFPEVYERTGRELSDLLLVNEAEAFLETSFEQRFPGFKSGPIAYSSGPPRGNLIREDWSVSADDMDSESWESYCSPDDEFTDPPRDV